MVMAGIASDDDVQNTIPITLLQTEVQKAALFPNDDWTGISSSAERRKRQNRMNQRKHRTKRINAEHVSKISTVSSNKNLVYIRPVKDIKPTGEVLVHRELDLWTTFQNAADELQFSRQKLARAATLSRSEVMVPETLITHFNHWIQRNRQCGSPKVDQVLTLVKFNVFRALIANSTTLGFPAETRMEDSALSPFTSIPKTAGYALDLPGALKPTKLQCQLPHHPWIDLIPIPQMRDNLLRAGDFYDDLELCATLVGYFNSPSSKTGLIVWGEPWDPAGWEVTEDFVTHWGWTIVGCKDLFRSTNHWRRLRGESALRFDKVAT